MRPEVQAGIIVSDGDDKIGVPSTNSADRHMIRYDPEVSRNGYRVAQGTSMDDVRNVLDGNQEGIDS
jgi:hypothetical protein